MRNGELKAVKQAQDFFRGVKADEVIESFENPAYGKFIRKINDAENRCSNVATLLDRIAEYAHLEQYLVLGIDFPMWSRFNKPVTNLPKEIVKFFQECRFEIQGNTFEQAYSRRPALILNLITHVRNKYHMDLEVYKWAYELITVSDYINKFSLLTANTGEETILQYRGDTNWRHQIRPHVMDRGYGCDYKSLFDYLVRADRAEANNFLSALSTYKDYRSMFRQMNAMDEENNNQMVNGEMPEVERRANVVEKYPKYLSVYHDILTRNFRAYKLEVDEVEFSANVDFRLEYAWDAYEVMMPKNSEWVKQEGINLSHCVAQYVKQIMDGTTQIALMRERKNPDVSMVTLEIRNGRLVQAKGYKNRAVNDREKKWLKTYAKAKELTYA